MKILSLTQPFASLVDIGAKKIETRSWYTYYRGWIGIHASKGFPGWAAALCNDEPFKSVLKQAGYISTSHLPRGVILAVCKLDGVYPTLNNDVLVNTCQVLGLSDQERAFGDYSPNRYAFLLSHINPMTIPIPARGALGLWECDDPRLEDAAWQVQP